MSLSIKYIISPQKLKSDFFYHFVHKITVIILIIFQTFCVALACHVYNFVSTVPSFCLRPMPSDP